MIADYEALEHKKFYFWRTPNEPKYIHYVGHSDDFDQWKEKSENLRCCIFKRYEKKADFIQYDFDDNDSDNKKVVYGIFKRKKKINRLIMTMVIAISTLVTMRKMD